MNFCSLTSCDHHLHCTGCSGDSLYRVLCVLFVRVSCVQFVGCAMSTVCTGYLLENSRVSYIRVYICTYVRMSSELLL